LGPMISSTLTGATFHPPAAIAAPIGRYWPTEHARIRRNSYYIFNQ
jgi:hypothetical protein